MRSYLAQILDEAFALLEPFSRKYTVDRQRYLYTLKLACSLGDVKQMNILDLGCGVGITSLVLKKLGANVTGLDKYLFSDEETPLFALADIDKLRDKWRSLDLNINEADLFDVGAEKFSNFDLIIAEAIIEHQTDPKKFLLKIHSLLKPNGLAIISSPNLTTLLKRLRFLLGRSPNWDLKQFFELGNRFTGHWREYTPSELHAMGKWAGFEVIGLKNVNLLTRFKGFKRFRLIYLYILKFISDFIPNTRDMNYLIIKKPE